MSPAAPDPTPPALDDPDHVRTEYADESGLAGRKALWRRCTGIQPPAIALDRVRALAPGRVLEVGCGAGELAAALTASPGLEVTAIDQSERMVQLTADRGVDARLADVTALPFADGSFDVAVAAYMLYHVADLDRGLSELVRVLRPGGTLVAVTNDARQLAELWEPIGAGLDHHDPFSSETGGVALERCFETVTRIDVSSRFAVPVAAARDYVRATRFASLADRVPDAPDPLTVTACGTVFVATTAG